MLGKQLLISTSDETVGEQRTGLAHRIILRKEFMNVYFEITPKIKNYLNTACYIPGSSLIELPEEWSKSPTTLFFKKLTDIT